MTPEYDEAEARRAHAGLAPAVRIDMFFLRAGKENLLNGAEGLEMFLQERLRI
eukprot:CAMPEP_0194774178 /NCGR_PEP_ID=MMETSP0323_2-20130528/56977_1 /TAXON_ID=2866 ORGANISM="Crypthecodinium cohnii, Strain Seligo" /NCGR_SAMPLE_ID=MMETSP0323_2 /ASSEMBLY_ACC=CAM_ASM_000346 /LENGTH=52 /DNA_ID=CAMNT_0039709611 /DNA_START=145 /DNA_END=301 /DNA_ORIENTATION=+